MAQVEETIHYYKERRFSLPPETNWAEVDKAIASIKATLPDHLRGKDDAVKVVSNDSGIHFLYEEEIEEPSGGRDNAYVESAELRNLLRHIWFALIGRGGVHRSMAWEDFYRELDGRQMDLWADVIDKVKDQGKISRPWQANVKGKTKSE